MEGWVVTEKGKRPAEKTRTPFIAPRALCETLERPLPRKHFLFCAEEKAKRIPRKILHTPIIAESL